MSMNVLFGVFIINLSLFSQADTVYFSSEKTGLILLTQNIDSIKYFPETPPPNPFSPTMDSYSVRINTYDTTNLTVNFKDIYEEVLIVYKWNNIPPGAYKFEWWNYIQSLQSGTYFTEKIIGNKSEINKVIYIK